MIELLKIILSLSISGTLLILVLLLCKPFIKNKFSKRWQYYIWLIVIARLLLPLAFEASLMGTLFRHFDSTVIQTQENQQPEQNFFTFSGTTLSNHDNQAEFSDDPYLNSQTPPVQKLGVICLFIWLMTAVGLLIRKITVYQSFVKYMKAGRLEVSDLDLWERMGKLMEQTGVKGTLGLYTNSLISSPLLIGFFRPCIMLPTTQLTDSDFQNTIIHELTHFKRLDMFYKWLVQFTVCLHWFNPLVYIMSREINRACELSCDEAVIFALNTEGRQAYGDTLLNAMETGGNYKDSLASLTLSESKERLKERLDSIMNLKRKTKMTAVISMTFAFVLCFGATAAGAYVPAPEVSKYETVPNSTVIGLTNNGGKSITQSGSFEATENQALILTVQSDIKGGMVDLFLFSPDGKEQRLTFNGSNQTETVTLSAGIWKYNCTGFFTSGDISISGTLINSDALPEEGLGSSANADVNPTEQKNADSSVISFTSNGVGSITQSGSFEATENQVLILTVQSDIQGGTVDLTLFSPGGKEQGLTKEQRLTFNGSNQTNTIALSPGIWQYNCTGFFTSGDISILGQIENQ